MKIGHIVSLVVLVCSTFVLAQPTNIRHTFTDDELLVIYDLDSEIDQKYEITLRVRFTEENGSIVIYTPSRTFGANRRKVSPGKELEIRWDYKREFPGIEKKKDLSVIVEASAEQSKMKTSYGAFLGFPLTEFKERVDNGFGFMYTIERQNDLPLTYTLTVGVMRFPGAEREYIYESHYYHYYDYDDFFMIPFWAKTKFTPTDIFYISGGPGLAYVSGERNHVLTGFSASIGLDIPLYTETALDVAFSYTSYFKREFNISFIGAEVSFKFY